MMHRRVISCVLLSALAVLASQTLTGCDDESSERACALLTPLDCASRPYCGLVTATGLNSERQCRYATGPIACSSLKPCDDALTLARDRDGFLFLLPNTCLPEGWEEASEAGDTGELEAWPSCD